MEYSTSCMYGDCETETALLGKSHCALPNSVIFNGDFNNYK